MVVGYGYWGEESVQFFTANECQLMRIERRSEAEKEGCCRRQIEDWVLLSQ